MKTSLDPKGHQNIITDSTVLAILLDGWTLAIVGVAPGACIAGLFLIIKTVNVSLSYRNFYTLFQIIAIKSTTILEIKG